MSQENQNMHGCRKPENLRGEPAHCSPEQIRRCHGDTAGHTCVGTEGCEHPEHLKGEPGECSPEQVRECQGNSAAYPCE